MTDLPIFQHQQIKPINIHQTTPMKIPLTPRRFHHIVTVFGLLVLLLSATSLNAQSLYWKGGTGDWSTSDANWSTTANGSATEVWSGNSTNAIFGDTGTTVSATENLTAGGMAFNVNGYTINASTNRTLTFNGSSPTIDVSSGNTATVGAAIQLLSANKTITKTGAGTLDIKSTNNVLGPLATSDNTQFIVQEGTVLINSATAFGNSKTRLVVSNGASVEVNGFTNIGGLAGNGTINRTGTKSYISIRGDSSNFSGVISGHLEVSKINGTGTQIFSGNQSNTYNGSTKVSVGTLVLAKTDGATAIAGDKIILGIASAIHPSLRLDGDEQIANTTSFEFVANNQGNATFNLNGHSETLGSLTVNALGVGGSNKIDFGLNAVAQVLQFDSLSINNDGRLDIVNFGLGVDDLRFTSDPTSQLARLFINNNTATAINQGAYWSVVPEPSTVGLIGFVAVTAALMRLRSRRKDSGA